MGNSTITLQAMMDSIATIGDLKTVFDSTGGWADEPAITIGNDVMEELISVRFPWKWNRMKLPGFPLTSLQQDYATPITDIGWLESGWRVDINNTHLPPPTWPLYAVRDLASSHAMAGFPFQVCWFYNRDLEQGLWPGPNVKYTQPIGAKVAPQNPRTNIQDANGNILILTVYGITGSTPPLAPAWTNTTQPQPPNWPVGQTIQDGTCVWLIVSPDAQGFRFNPMPPSGAQVWLIRLIAQRKAPIFTKLRQPIDPVPDDQSKWFRDGCVAYAHRYSTNPNVQARFDMKKLNWLQAMADETKSNDKEDEAKGFFPDRNIMAPSWTTDPGPWPFRWGWR